MGVILQKITFVYLRGCKLLYGNPEAFRLVLLRAVSDVGNADFFLV